MNNIRWGLSINAIGAAVRIAFAGMFGRAVAVELHVISFCSNRLMATGTRAWMRTNTATRTRVGSILVHIWWFSSVLSHLQFQPEAPFSLQQQPQLVTISTIKIKLIAAPFTYSKRNKFARNFIRFTHIGNAGAANSLSVSKSMANGRNESSSKWNKQQHKIISAT